MTKNTQWLNQLFESYIQNSKVTLYFEEKKKLQEKQSTINLSIHPVRFADDIFFNFQTNDIELEKKLKAYSVDDNIFYKYADIVKAGSLKINKRSIIKTNAFLLIGQTEKDKVIFNGEKYLSLLDYIADIKEIACHYESIYFKPHPYAKNNKQIYKVLQKEFKNITIIYDNIYHLLSDENIMHVAALNSSVLYEAKYFRKDVTFLYKPTFDFDGKDIGIYGEYWNSSFWSDILDIEDAHISLPFMPNRLRKTINDFWGYNEISDEIILRDILKSKIKYFLSRYL